MYDKVLLIAINEYKGCTSLNGCLEDADDIYRTIVEKQHYNPEHIRYLANDQATKTNIQQSLQWFGGARSGFFFYAGHGTLSQDLKPALVSHDCGEHWSDLICKADIEALCAGMNATILIDCCHSGSLFSFSQRNGNDWVERYVVNPLLDPARLKSWLESRVAIRDEPKPHLQEDTSLTYLCGCDDAETSKEIYIDQKVRGLFSYFLCKTLRNNQDISVGDLWDRVRRLVKSYIDENHTSPQTPQLWCNESVLHQPFLGGKA